jgi:hypothetical protein
MVKSYETGEGLKAGVNDCLQSLFSAFTTILKMILQMFG